MKIVSFSCKKKLRKLLNRECNQTIRPVNKRTYKVGEKLKLVWKQRAKRNCKNCLRDCQSRGMDINTKCSQFDNIIGLVELTDIIPSEILIDEISNFKIKINSNEQPLTRKELKKLAKKDGFENIWNFIRWFDKHYDLKIPKKFRILRWKWISKNKTKH